MSKRYYFKLYSACDCFSLNKGFGIELKHVLSTDLCFVDDPSSLCNIKKGLNPIPSNPSNKLTTTIELSMMVGTLIIDRMFILPTTLPPHLTLTFILEKLEFNY